MRGHKRGKREVEGREKGAGGSDIEKLEESEKRWGKGGGHGRGRSGVGKRGRGERLGKRGVMKGEGREVAEER